SAAEMRRDLEVIATGLPKAPPLGRLVHEPAVEVPEAETTAPVQVGPEQTQTVTIERARNAPNRARRRLATVLLVLLGAWVVAGAALGAWLYVIPHYADVPRVIGEPTRSAQNRLEDLGLTVKIAQGEYSTQVPGGTVIRVSPATGTHLRTGSVVTLLPSL